MDGSPYKMRPTLLTTTTGAGSNQIGPTAHTTHAGGPSTEPVTPPPPMSLHSSQVARAHPYAAALPSAPLPPSSSSALSGRYTGQSTIDGRSPSSAGVYATSAAYNSNRNEALAFPLRSPPDRTGVRRLTLLPHSGVPLDYGGGGGGPPGPGGGGGGSSNSGAGAGGNNSVRHTGILSIQQQQQQYHHSQMAPYSTNNDYREALILPVVSTGESAHKKLRIAGISSSIGDPIKITIGQPLRIDTRPIMTTSTGGSLTSSSTSIRDTRDQPAYIPQVEAISPTPDSPLRSTKDDLLQQITKVSYFNWPIISRQITSSHLPP